MAGRTASARPEGKDRTTTVQEMKDVVRAFCEARDWDQFHDPKELAIAISTEAAELLDIARFKSKDELVELLKTPGGRERVEDEVADVLYFVLRFAQMNGIELAAALKAKLAKNEKKYPVHKARGSNKKYTEL